jgi:hypothetical protein
MYMNETKRCVWVMRVSVRMAATEHERVQMRLFAIRTVQHFTVTTHNTKE